MTRMTDENFLVINADYFYEDFKRSYYQFARPAISPGGVKRDIALKNYEEMKKIKEKEILRTMDAVHGKLDNWPIRKKQLIFSPVLVDKMEEEGKI